MEFGEPSADDGEHGSDVVPGAADGFRYNRRAGADKYRSNPIDNKTRTNLMKRAIVLAALVLPLILACNAEAGLKDGIEAFNHKDYARALREFLPLADDGNARAQMYLGGMYLFGFSVPRSPATAFKWYQQAAHQGLPWAQYNLASLYYAGKGTDKSREKALQWYRKAARQGIPDAQFNLGFMYEHGQGTARDYALAVRWYHKAARYGYPRALHNLGIMYMQGKGVASDPVKAYMWFDLAKAAGDEKAAAARRRVASRMRPEQIAQAMDLAKEWKRKYTRRTLDAAQSP